MASGRALLLSAPEPPPTHMNRDKCAELRFVPQTLPERQGATPLGVLPDFAQQHNSRGGKNNKTFWLNLSHWLKSD